MISNSVSPGAGPQKIMLIRHAEKPNDGPPFGVKEDGTVNKHSIVVRGWQRAGALVQFFANPTHRKIATPAVIFAATTTDSSEVKPDDAKSLRPQETIGPVAAKLGCPRNAKISVGDEPRLIAALRRTPGVVLVAWEHKRIPAIASAFASVPQEWGDDVFDVVWVLDRRPDGAYDFSVVQQNLLFGDSTSAQEPAPDAGQGSVTE
jgi:hypothetical protein